MNGMMNGGMGLSVGGAESAFVVKTWEDDKIGQGRAGQGQGKGKHWESSALSIETCPVLSNT